MHALSAQQDTDLARNFRRVKDRIETAARRAGRPPESVRLVAVTKAAPVKVVPALLALGVDAIGENRPEEIWHKQRELAECRVPWHLIGHFQRKKIPRTLPLLDAVHSVHALELLATLDVRLDRDRESGPLAVLLQINVSGEPTKQGFRPQDAIHVADLAGAMTNVRLMGLMTMAPESAGPDRLHEVFGRLRELRSRIGIDRAPELSMGMSGDFEIAIEEGATLVRIGTALFEGLGFES